MKRLGKKHYSFKKAYLQIPQGDIDRVKEELQKALAIKQKTYFSSLLNNGICDPRISVIDNVSSVFQKHGITKAWEIKDESKCSSNRKTK